MPRLRMHCAGMTGAPTIDMAVDGSWCLRRLVVHHMASVLSGLEPIRLRPVRDVVEQSEIFTESASTAAGGHDMYVCARLQSSQTPASWFSGSRFAAGEGRKGEGKGGKEEKGRVAFSHFFFFTI